MIIQLSREQMEILNHTIHRTANGLYCGGSDAMSELVRAGYMRSQGKTGFCPDEYFSITPLGREEFHKEATK